MILSHPSRTAPPDPGRQKMNLPFATPAQARDWIVDKAIDGFSAMFHRVSFETIGLSTIQSRACAGVANGTFIFCLPGSGGAVRDGWDKIIVHQLDARTRPCNLVEIMPRLMER